MKGCVAEELSAVRCDLYTASGTMVSPRENAGLRRSTTMEAYGRITITARGNSVLPREKNTLGDPRSILHRLTFEAACPPTVQIVAVRYLGVIAALPFQLRGVSRLKMLSVEIDERRHGER